MNVRVAVPRRSDDGRRDDLWKFCRNWWADNHPTLEVVEGHHVEGPFNRAAAINRAADGSWDVLVVADGDVIADPQQVTGAVERAATTGRMTLAYTHYAALNQQMTDRVLAGYDGDWAPGAKLRMTTHVSSIVAVPRTLWDKVAGFDERFVGWGYEDLAFAAACRVLGGGLERISGTVWHLWHPDSPERNRKSSGMRAGAGLSARYLWAVDPTAMEALIAERVDDGVVLVVVTDGRRHCIAESIPAAEKRLTGLPIVRKVICDDSGDGDYQAWLRLEFPGYELVHRGKRRGFGGAVSCAWETALASGAPWVFWLEDDMLLEREVDLAAIARVLTHNPHVLQMALRRQAWFQAELEAGGVVEQYPEAYDDCQNAEGDSWLEHRLFWTTNPHLVARAVLAAHTWPVKSHSEALFARQALVGTNRSGYWGRRDDDPHVTHIGAERSGNGY